MPTATQKSRKNVAHQPATDAKRPAVAQIIGTVIDGGELGSVTGRGRTAEPLPAELVEQLEGFCANGGAGRASGSAAEVAKLMRQVTRWAKDQTEAGNATQQGFRVEAKDAQNRPTQIRYSVHRVNVDATK